MRVLTDPARTGAVTLALPQDVQTEAFDWPDELFAERVWHVPRPVPEPAALARAAAVIRSAARPLIVAGGGVIYSGATAQLQAFAEATGVPVAETQAGKGSLRYDHPLALSAIGATGTTAANRIAREADVVIGIGTRYSDFRSDSGREGLAALRPPTRAECDRGDRHHRRQPDRPGGRRGNRHRHPLQRLQIGLRPGRARCATTTHSR